MLLQNLLRQSVESLQRKERIMAHGSSTPRSIACLRHIWSSVSLLRGCELLEAILPVYSACVVLPTVSVSVSTPFLHVHLVGTMS